jgi:hypothetical protein
MNRLEAWFLHLSNLLVGGTGLIYAGMLYLLEPADPYAVVHHPLQPLLQHLHVWTAPLLVFGAGLIWQNHVWVHFRRGVQPRRRSGLTLMLSLVPMVASGYLIQTAVAPAWRTAWVAIHLVASVLWLAGYLGHLVALLGRRRSGQRGAARQRVVGAPLSEAGPVRRHARAV